MSSAVTTWVNGQLVDGARPSIAAVDHGITVGDGAFESCKIIDGRVFAPSRHLRRLERTLDGLGLDGFDAERLMAGVDAVLEAAGPMPLGRTRWTVTGGPGPFGSDRGEGPLTYVVGLVPAQPLPSHGHLATVPWTRNERAATAGLKTTSYADNVIALARARAHGADEAIFANTRGELCEGTGSNVFVVRDGVILTPPLDSGCLAGVTRDLTIARCREAGMEVREEALPMTALTDSDEVFLTNTMRDVQPVGSVDGRELGTATPVTDRAAQVFAAKVEEGMDP
ncbi:aminodeoxychorismate lyase [Marihabitans asiaticum]|uniref:Branched-chain amino acid aminotransferase n=1 Tax=Marihabitans asiaticum TaxID=415218 RepID=A0A560W6S4_9MICO|nr:aminotransferase class IV [Marihabitans asiaticum]TWD13317.1 branched-chain amino acid aminotransferase [Marihabitans asiaticum]